MEQPIKSFEIKQSVISSKGEHFNLVYRESDPDSGLEGKILRETRSVCFCGDKMVIVFEPAKNGWTVPGGKVESGENSRQAAEREVVEETGMEILGYELIGYQDSCPISETKEPILRYPFSFLKLKSVDGPINDPDGDVTQIKLIDPKDYKQYFDWGPIGDRVVERAIELNKDFGISNSNQ